ncbi:DedA family protein [Clostridium sp. LIBA-8841]|uniref:DedA family protein n=1 Tax=Clostridium sp. LIBA-8841 TaxID=2987530 RepID=UPI002AC3F8F0|nr:DedA family protein [Clostridium sp. LIBA-8841]MDZ5255127.1 DedA family protein [Clostridium sp. LIBA-8841]
MNYIALIKMFILKYGAISIFFTSLLEYLSMPIPSEVVLPFVGAVAKSNNQNIYFLTLVAVLGGSVGSLIMFLLGKYLIKNFIDDLRAKHPKLNKSVEKSQKLLFKYRYIGVFLSRVIPMARAVISIVSGIIGMKLHRFLFFSALGMILWDFTLIKLGTIYTQNYTVIDSVVKKYSWVLGGALILLIIFYFIFKYIKSKRKNKV